MRLATSRFVRSSTQNGSPSLSHGSGCWWESLGHWEMAVVSGTQTLTALSDVLHEQLPVVTAWYLGPLISSPPSWAANRTKVAQYCGFMGRC